MPDAMIQKPITFRVPADITTTHCTHLVVQPMPGRFLLSFFEVLPPLIVGETEQDKRQQWDRISSVQATCVARLCVAAADLEGFVHVLQQQQQLAQQQTMQEQQRTQQQAMQGWKAFT